jgi:AGZA family xanthine/uracil permease-like MFS transporter
MLYNGVSSILTGAFGSPFPTSIYIGHPGWKAIGSRVGYSVLNAVFVSILCLTGALSWVVYFVPVEAGMAILIWIGVAMASQAFEASPARHIPAVVVGMMPVLAAFCALLVKKTLVSLGFGGADKPFPTDMVTRSSRRPIFLCRACSRWSRATYTPQWFLVLRPYISLSGSLAERPFGS